MSPRFESHPTSVLIVESQLDDLETLRSCIADAGFEWIEARGVGDALELVKERCPDLVVSELALRDGSGFSLCRQLRDSAEQPLPIMLTSRWSREADRVLAFECGADDFIAKPYFPRELASRVRAVMRRTEALKRERQSFAEESAAPIRIDHERQAVIIEGRAVSLTLQEFLLLSIMIGRRGQVFSREELIGRAWRPDEQPNSRSVDAHIKGLRHKLGEFGRALETVRGIGYRYSEEGLGRRHHQGGRSKSEVQTPAAVHETSIETRRAGDGHEAPQGPTPPKS